MKKIVSFAVIVMTGMMGAGNLFASSWFDGFEDGLGNWTVEPASGDIEAVSSFETTLSGTYTINPYSGNALAVSRQAAGLKSTMNRTTFDPGGEQGILSAWINIASLDAASALLLGIGDADGNAFFLRFDTNVPGLLYRSTFKSETNSGLSEVDALRTWAKIDFEASESGTSLYYNDQFVYTETNMTNIAKVTAAGAYWAASGEYSQICVDDVSFVAAVPEPNTMSLIFMGAVFVVCRKRKGIRL